MIRLKKKNYKSLNYSPPTPLNLTDFTSEEGWTYNQDFMVN